MISQEKVSFPVQSLSHLNKAAMTDNKDNWSAKKGAENLLSMLKFKLLLPNFFRFLTFLNKKNNVL